MPSSERVTWQPISQMSLVANMIDSALNDTADHIQTLTEARARPHVLDDVTIDRVERVHGEQLEFVDIFAEQLRAGGTKVRPLHNGRSWTAWKSRTVACARSPRRSSPSPPSSARGTIDRIMAMSDLELGLQALLGTLPPGRS